MLDRVCNPLPSPAARTCLSCPELKCSKGSNALRVHRTGYLLDRSSLMLERSGMLASSLDLSAAGGEVDPRVQQTIDTMTTRLHTRLVVGELAGAVGLSVAQLARLFRRDTGTTPGVFLRRLRQARARALEGTTCPTCGHSAVLIVHMTQTGDYWRCESCAGMWYSEGDRPDRTPVERRRRRTDKP